MERKPQILVIVGSTRPGRIGGTVGEWVAEQAARNQQIEVTVADLAEIDLPLFDEPNHPKMQQYVHQHTKDWSAMVAAADGFILVTPEYNHGYSAPVKNALDYVYHEWVKKPIAFVSYGSIAGGSRAAEQLKQVVLELQMVPVHAQVILPLDFGGEDKLSGLKNPMTVKAHEAMVAELAQWAVALRGMRDSQGAKV